MPTSVSSTNWSGNNSIFYPWYAFPTFPLPCVSASNRLQASHRSHKFVHTYYTQQCTSYLYTFFTQPGTKFELRLDTLLKFAFYLCHHLKYTLQIEAYCERFICSRLHFHKMSSVWLGFLISAEESLGGGSAWSDRQVPSYREAITRGPIGPQSRCFQLLPLEEARTEQKTLSGLASRLVAVN